MSTVETKYERRKVSENQLMITASAIAETSVLYCHESVFEAIRDDFTKDRSR